MAGGGGGQQIFPLRVKMVFVVLVVLVVFTGSSFLFDGKELDKVSTRDQHL
jgi:hypothetical protein